jgi:5,10-methylene-tetrahydrofolate dehydrogenase/methenyl tetrahydrofolate cyclohydrolase
MPFQGCMELLERSGIEISGKRAVVVGRSNIVGTPAALLLQRRDATVTVVHSRTRDGAAICREADIVIAACGKAEMLTSDWIKPGAVVIDVGINAVDVRPVLQCLSLLRLALHLSNIKSLHH